MKETLDLVIVGHVDHGKSTLIGRLLYDTHSLPESKIREIERVCEEQGREMEFSFFIDHLTEERSQGITIDTSQIFFRTEQRRYVIIDAPGHVEFMRNMVTGASQAEAAILIIDAEEGIREQTRRHAYVLSMLGLDQVVVVINKMDRIGRRQELFEELKAETGQFLATMGIKPAHVIPISAYEGDNVAATGTSMPWYSGPCVLEALESFSGTEAVLDKPARFAVQDVYRNGDSIVAGMMESGRLRAGDVLTALPGGDRLAVRSMAEFEAEPPAEIEAGKSSGLLVDESSGVRRGQILCGEGKLPQVGNEIDAHLFWMDSEGVRVGDKLIFKCSTQQSVCEVADIRGVLNSSTLEPVDRKGDLQINEIADVTLKTADPVVTEAFAETKELGRFVLERLNTVAGGIIRSGT